MWWPRSRRWRHEIRPGPEPPHWQVRQGGPGAWRHREPQAYARAVQGRAHRGRVGHDTGGSGRWGRIAQSTGVTSYGRAPSKLYPESWGKPRQGRHDTGGKGPHGPPFRIHRRNRQIIVPTGWEGPFNLMGGHSCNGPARSPDHRRLVPSLRLTPANTVSWRTDEWRSDPGPRHQWPASN
jgi:hypothetical protein